MSYLAITPARNEEQLLPQLIDSMVRQTVLPSRWIIINDGSTDRTALIIDQAAQEHGWIEPRHRAPASGRAPGGEGAIDGLLSSAALSYLHVLRLDADLSFGPELVALLLHEFASDPHLGIAGATLWEPYRGRWREILTPRFHTRGAAKMYSRICLNAIGGLDSGLGWDTVDEATAMMKGYVSRSFRHIRAYHHRPQAQANGKWRGRLASGRAAYRSGYSPAFMLARATAHLANSPYLIGSVLMMWGFLEGYFRRLPLAASPELVRFIRREQRRRLLMLDSRWR